MSKRRQHPLITAMNRFDALLAGMDSVNIEPFMAYVRNKVSTRRPKSQSSSVPSAGRRSRRQSTPTTSTPSTEADSASAMTASGD